MRRRFMPVFSLLLLGLAAVGQSNSPSGGSAAAKGETLSGNRLYAANCALCHGGDGKGGGPFSAQLKTWPPDLTQLAKKNGGVFPAMHVSETIDGEFEKPAHGTREMPVWGPVFRSMAHGHSDSAQVRINRLVKFLESLQQK